MNPVYLGDSRILVRTCYGAGLIIPAHDLSMSPSLISSGAHELPLTKYLVATVQRAHRVIDVGAHVGYFTVLLANLVGDRGRVVAYEANPEVYAYLFDNLSINYLHDRVTVHNRAVASEACDVTLHACRRFHGNSSLHPHPDMYHRHYRDEIVEVTVAADPLETAIDTLVEVDLVKLDIEGGEYAAFLGMASALRTRQVRQVVFEINATMMQGDYGNFGTVLRDLEKSGRAFFTLSAEGERAPVELELLLEQGSCPHVVMI